MDPTRKKFSTNGSGTIRDVFQRTYAFQDARLARATGSYPFFMPISESDATEVVVDGRRFIMLGSNNYLGLTHHPEVVEAARRAVNRYGTSCTGSRLLNGTLDLHVELETRLARFVGKEAALVFSTGYQSNLAVLSCLVGRGDVVLRDRENHASIVDGCSLAFGQTLAIPPQRHERPRANPDEALAGTRSPGGHRRRVQHGR
jgi:7-keto-8-aminopelargonate synthetase-like enzyme